jgi:hypothetical protein
VSLLLGCAAESDEARHSDSVIDEASTQTVTITSPANVVLPPAGAEFDYQLGEAYAPAADVAVLSRDRNDEPDPVRYTICYVNGFQTQPNEARIWMGDNADLVLRDGEPVTDPDWPDEMILDTSTSDRRQRLTAIVGEWIDQCAADGFDAIEIDNLDSFTRFEDRLTEDDAVAFARALTARAHAAGVAIAQKNTVELLDRRTETGFDFAIVEQCNEYQECDAFTAVYGNQVYVIEYDRDAFESGCKDFPDLSIVYRDRDVSAPGSDTYARDAC